MAVTIAEVAKRAGVGKTTVSRVLNGKGGVGRETADRVAAVIEELGFVPSSAAVGLARRGRTGTIGLLVPALNPAAPAPLLQSPWTAEILQAVSDVVTAAGCRLRLFSCDGGERSLQRFRSQVLAKSIDGLIVLEPQSLTDVLIDLDQHGLPVVLVDDRDHRMLLPTVSTTNHEGGQSAARHLMDLGRHRPLVVTGKREFGCTQQRLDGFCQVYVEAGLPVAPEYVIDADFTYAGGARAVRQAVEEGMEFDAVFAHNDLSAVGALRALRQAARGGRTEADVALVGFDDIPVPSQAGHPLTTVRQPLREMGEAAAGMLLARLDGTAAPETARVIPTDLVVRRTAIA